MPLSVDVHPATALGSVSSNKLCDPGTALPSLGLCCHLSPVSPWPPQGLWSASKICDEQKLWKQVGHICSYVPIGEFCGTAESSFAVRLVCSPPFRRSQLCVRRSQLYVASLLRASLKCGNKDTCFPRCGSECLRTRPWGAVIGVAAAVGCRRSGTPLSTLLALGWGWVPRASLHGEKAPDAPSGAVQGAPLWSGPRPEG